MPMELAIALAGLALYDIVIFVDDSGAQLLPFTTLSDTSALCPWALLRHCSILHPGHASLWLWPFLILLFASSHFAI